MSRDDEKMTGDDVFGIKVVKRSARVMPTEFLRSKPELMSWKHPLRWCLRSCWRRQNERSDEFIELEHPSGILEVAGW